MYLHGGAYYYFSIIIEAKLFDRVNENVNRSKKRLVTLKLFYTQKIAQTQNLI